MAELAKADLGLNPSLQQWACKHQQRSWVLEWCTHALWFDSWPYPRIDPCLLCPPQSASVPQIPRLISFMSSALKALWHYRTLEDQAVYSAVSRRKIATFHTQATKPPPTKLILTLYLFHYLHSFRIPQLFHSTRPLPQPSPLHIPRPVVPASCMAGHQCHTWDFQWLCI